MNDIATDENAVSVGIWVICGLLALLGGAGALLVKQKIKSDKAIEEMRNAEVDKVLQRIEDTVDKMSSAVMNHEARLTVLENT